MALLLSNTLDANPTVTMNDLIQIVNGDAGLSSALDSSGHYIIGYVRNLSDHASGRIDDVVNQTSQPIIVLGGMSSLLIGTMALGDVGGVAVEDNGLIWVAYDIEDCYGNGRYVYDTSGLAIYAGPPYVVLFHELVHAFHMDQNTIPSSEAAAEFQAITETNMLRARQGYPHRDPNNHNGGCGSVGAANNPPDQTGSVDNPCGQTQGCCVYVASAAVVFTTAVIQLMRMWG